MRWVFGCLILMSALQASPAAHAAHPAPGASPGDSVAGQMIARPPLEPGRYTTLAFHLTNLTDEPLHSIARLGLPDRWEAVTSERGVDLPPHGVALVPFTIRADPRARADQTYAIHLILAGQSDETLERVAAEVTVSAVEALSVTGIDLPTEGHPGETLVHQFRVTNRGNVAVLPIVDVESVPAYAIDVDEVVDPLDPGHSITVAARVRIPESAQVGQPHVVEFQAFTESRKVEQPRPPDACVRVVADVRRPPTAVPAYQHLPVESQVYHEHTSDGRDLQGLRLNTGGELWPQTKIHLDLHLLSDGRSGSDEGWRRQRVKLDVDRRSWHATAGDLQETFSFLTLNTLWGRGVRLEHRGAQSGISLYGVRDRNHLAQSAYALKLTRSLGSEWSIRCESAYQRDEEVAAGQTGDQTVTAATVRLERERLDVDLTGAWSMHEDQGIWSGGRAVQLETAYHRPDVTVNLRSYAGSDRFVGGTQNRDGTLAHVRVSPRWGWSRAQSGHRLPRRPVSVWMSYDIHQGRVALSPEADEEYQQRTRIGSQASHGRWPAVEVSAGREDSRQGDGDRNVSRNDLQLSTWKNIWRLMVAGNARWGRVLDRARPGHGMLGSWGLSVGGRWRAIHGALRWNASREWSPETRADHRRLTLGGDLAWTPRRGPLQTGLGISIRQDRAEPTQEGVTAGNSAEEILLRPRIDVRLTSSLSIRYEHAFAGAGDGLKTETARLQLTWASDVGLPVVWQPLRAGLLGTVFIDEDLDGHPDPGEAAVANVAAILEGTHLLTNDDGVFENGALRPGDYWLDLNLNTLPAGLVPAREFPITLRIEAGRVLEVHIPLVRCNSFSGVVYRDRNRDGSRSPSEPGLANVLVVLQDAEGLPRNAQTRSTGRFQFDGVRPGRYWLGLDQNWLPPDWSPTGLDGLEIDLGMDGKESEPAFGVAPMQKPIVHTYHAPAVGPSARGPLEEPSAGESPEEPAPAPTEPGAASHGLKIQRAVVATGVIDREPVGVDTTFTSDTGTLCFFTHLENPGPVTTIDHVWYHGAEEMARIPLRIETPTWRTWSSKRIRPDWTGLWRVEVQDARGRVIRSLEFEYAP